MPVKVGDHVVRCDRFVKSVPVVGDPPVGVEPAVGHDDDRAPAVAHVGGEVFTYELQRELRIVPRQRVADLGMLAIGRIEVRLDEVHPVPVPRVMQLVGGDVRDQLLVEPAEIALANLLLHAEAMLDGGGGRAVVVPPAFEDRKLQQPVAAIQPELVLKVIPLDLGLPLPVAIVNQVAQHQHPSGLVDGVPPERVGPRLAGKFIHPAECHAVTVIAFEFFERLVMRVGRREKRDRGLLGPGGGQSPARHAGPAPQGPCQQPGQPRLPTPGRSQCPASAAIANHASELCRAARRVQWLRCTHSPTHAGPPSRMV